MKKIECIFVIIGYYNPKLTDQLIKSFKEFLPKEKLYLYDNSMDPALKKIAVFYRMPYYASEINLGFSEGSNNALKWVLRSNNPTSICILNNDLIIDKKFALQFPKSLQKFIKNKKNAAMTPLLFQDKNFKKPEN